MYVHTYIHTNNSFTGIMYELLHYKDIIFVVLKKKFDLKGHFYI